MSAHVLLKITERVGGRDEIRDSLNIFSLFCNEFYDC